MATLARASVSDLEDLLGQAKSLPQYDLPRSPEVGLCMVRGRISADGAPFNLGEMTITRCVVQLADATTGVSYITGRDKKKAELAALADALLQCGGLHVEQLEPIDKAILNERVERAREAASTRVEFFTMVRGED